MNPTESDHAAWQKQHIDWRREAFQLQITDFKHPLAPGHFGIGLTYNRHSNFSGITNLLPEEVPKVVATMVQHLLTLGEPGVKLVCQLADDADRQMGELSMAESPEASEARHSAAK